MFSRFAKVAFAVVLLSSTLSAQGQETGTTDYVLGNSSVMWLPRSTSLFLNPGELARLHQNEFLLSSSRFKSLSSMSSAFFLPGTGTFGLGISPSADSTKYTLGFGALVGGYHDVGVAVSVMPKVQGGFRFAFGGAIHLPASGRNSGFHLGVSLTNLPMDADFNAGVAYWILPDIVRIQLATRTDVERAEFAGADVRILGGLNLQVGTRGFKKALAGISYETSYAVAAFGGGPEGVSFSMNFRMNEAASELHDASFNDGDEAFIDGRYSDARDSFMEAVQYDEYDETSRHLAVQSQHLMDSLVTVLLQQAHRDEEQKNFSGAMKSYAQVLKIDPHQSIAATNLADVEHRVRLYTRELIAEGDSLRNIHQIDQARHSYELVLELQPDNDSASGRIDQLDALAKQNVRSILARAHALIRKNQLDEAQKEFERVLAEDPDNTSAKSGLRAIAGRRLSAQLALAQSEYDARKYFDALQILSDLVERDEKNRDAKDLLEKTRVALKSESDRLFKLGLQFYIKEDFKSAIAEWDKVLMIVPSDSSTREYRKRAEEKLKALEQYQ